MSAATAAQIRALARRPHDPNSPSLIPPIAAGHRDPIVRALAATLTTLYERRHVLREGLVGRLGNLVFPAFPELLVRPPKRVREGGDLPPGPDFDRRRSDGMEAIVRVILVLASCCDWTTMEIKDPQGGYLSVWRIAELAQLPSHLVAPRDEQDRRRRFRQDTVERVLRGLRIARIIAFTRQYREQLKDGRHTTTAPALRKLSVSFFRKFGGSLLKTFDWRRGKLKGRAERDERRDFKAGTGVDLRIAEVLRNLSNGNASRQSAPTATAAPDLDAPFKRVVPEAHSRLIPQALIDHVHDEHPDWTYPEILNEARRRLERGPPTSSSSEPPKSE